MQCLQRTLFVLFGLCLPGCFNGDLTDGKPGPTGDMGPRIFDLFASLMPLESKWDGKATNCPGALPPQLELKEKALVLPPRAGGLAFSKGCSYRYDLKLQAGLLQKEISSPQLTLSPSTTNCKAVLVLLGFVAADTKCKPLFSQTVGSTMTSDPTMTDLGRITGDFCLEIKSDDLSCGFNTDIALSLARFQATYLD